MERAIRTETVVDLECYRGCAICGLGWKNRWASIGPLCKVFCPYKKAIGENKMHIASPKTASPFLKVEHLKSKGVTTAMIKGVSDATGSEFSDYFMDVVIGKQQYTLGLKASGGNVSALTSQFGEDTDKWIGKKISLSKAEWKGKSYVKIAD